LFAARLFADGETSSARHFHFGSRKKNSELGHRPYWNEMIKEIPNQKENYLSALEVFF
jgi:hypothetical protein